MNMKKNGFSLVELIIAVAVGLLIMTAVYAMINLAQSSSVSVGRKIVTQQDARSVLDLMAMEIRMASYNPTMSTTIWSTIPTNCASISISLDPTKKGIQTATANTILVAMDLTNPTVYPAVIGDSPNEYIKYSYNGADTIYRNASCSGDTPLLGGTGSATMVANGTCSSYTNGTCTCAANINGTCPALFQYFDASGNNLADNTGTVPTTSIKNIRRIRITIVANTEYTDRLTHKSRIMTYTTDVLVKNHAFSP
jgi:prepilin-type N-terminal cleavage/methylation domain-containing protein